MKLVERNGEFILEPHTSDEAARLKEMAGRNVSADVTGCHPATCSRQDRPGHQSAAPA